MPTPTGPSLSVERYDAAEARAVAALSIPHLMAFRPAAFAQSGFPTRVTSEAELLRYADHNFEAEVPGLFKPKAVFQPIGYRNAFSLDEKNLIAGIRDRVASLTETAFGRRVRPVTNLLVQVGPFRMVQQLAAAFRQPSLAMFEVGPGAGYLGAFLASTGHRYLSYDVTQSLYLWQNRLLEAIAGSKLVELAGNDDGPLDGQVVHLPWWRYVSFLPGTAVRVDIVYSNSNLSEMTNLALRHVLHISRHMLADSKLGLFCFFSKGAPSQTPHAAIDEELRTFGYHKAFESPFHAFTLKPEQAQTLKNVFKDGLRLYNPSQSPTILEAADVVALRRAEAPLDVELTQWAHGWQPPFVD